jgi:TPR repeat protein
MRYHGEGGARDWAEARRLFGEGGKQLCEVRTDLGTMLLRGEGGGEDLVGGLRAWLRAAEAGDPRAAAYMAQARAALAPVVAAAAVPR